MLGCGVLWFGLGNPRLSQECPNIFYQSLKICNSAQRWGSRSGELYYSYLVYSVLKFPKI